MFWKSEMGKVIGASISAPPIYNIFLEVQMAKRKIKSQLGVSIIEFALVLPILLVILAGVIDISIMLYDKAVITNASREGARYGVVLRQPGYASSASIIEYTKTYCANNLITFATTPTSVVVTATPSVPNPQFGDTLNVTVSYTYTDLFLHNFINHLPQYTINSTTVMTYE
jgi:Flp pilus assembly protein TadG